MRKGEDDATKSGGRCVWRKKWRTCQWREEGPLCEMERGGPQPTLSGSPEVVTTQKREFPSVAGLVFRFLAAARGSLRKEIGRRGESPRAKFDQTRNCCRRKEGEEEGKEIQSPRRAISVCPRFPSTLYPFADHEGSPSSIRGNVSLCARVCGKMVVVPLWSERGCMVV